MRNQKKESMNVENVKVHQNLNNTLDLQWPKVSEFHMKLSNYSIHDVLVK